MLTTHEFASFFLVMFCIFISWFCFFVWLPWMWRLHIENIKYFQKHNVELFASHQLIKIDDFVKNIKQHKL